LLSITLSPRHCEQSEAIHLVAQRKNGLLRRCAPRNGGEATSLSHPQKIALADLDAIVAQNAVGGGGVEIEIRKRKAAGKLLASASWNCSGGREGDVFAIGAVELRGLND